MTLGVSNHHSRDRLTRVMASSPRPSIRAFLNKMLREPASVGASGNSRSLAWKYFAKSLEGKTPGVPGLWETITGMAISTPFPLSSAGKLSNTSRKIVSASSGSNTPLPMLGKTCRIASKGANFLRTAIARLVTSRASTLFGLRLSHKSESRRSSGFSGNFFNKKSR